jgi:hypothetical protein
MSARITRRLRHLRLSGLNVWTVLAVKGKESKAVMIKTVRSMRFGRVKDPGRVELVMETILVAEMLRSYAFWMQELKLLRLANPRKASTSTNKAK